MIDKAVPPLCLWLIYCCHVDAFIRCFSTVVTVIPLYVFSLLLSYWYMYLYSFLLYCYHFDVCIPWFCTVVRLMPIFLDFVLLPRWCLYSLLLYYCHDGVFIPCFYTVVTLMPLFLAFAMLSRWCLYSLLLFRSQVDEESSLEYTICRCPHTGHSPSLFTTTFYVQPNLIDFSTISDFAKFDVNNAAVYGTLIAMLCLYVVLVIVLRRQDHKDTQKVRESKLFINQNTN
jgi:hypothetical protein